MQVVFQANAGITAGNETVQYDPTANTLTFQISPQTTANDIIAALQNNPTASAAFTASLGYAQRSATTTAAASFSRKRSR